MLCPSCGDNEYYYGLNGDNCPNPACVRVGNKRKSSPPLSTKAINNEEFYPTLPTVKQFIENMGHNVLRIPGVIFLYVDKCGKGSSKPSLINVTRPYIIIFQHETNTKYATHVFNQKFWQRAVAQGPFGTSATEIDAMRRFDEKWKKLDENNKYLLIRGMHTV